MITKVVVTLCVIGVALAQESPVFMWGANSVATPALKIVSQDEFGKIIVPFLKNHMVVAFLEDNLSPNDFLCANMDTKQSCYAKLQGVTDKTYYTRVENPVEALRSVAIQREFNSVDKSGQLSKPLECEEGKVVFVNFETTDEERGSLLESHDAAVSSITKEISCPTVYMYTSSTSSVKSRSRRTTAAARSGYVFRQGAQFLLFFSTLSVVDGTTTTDVVLNSMTVEDISTSQFKVTLTGTDSKTMTFLITNIIGSFAMSSLTYNSIDYRVSDMGAPTDLSYYCGNVTLAPTTTGSTAYLKWTGLQFQAPFGSTTDTSFVFGDAWQCVGFFSPGILSGLFVVALMLFITFVGVCWMMDINTMDRFDDPKGKTITINASE